MSKPCYCLISLATLNLQGQYLYNSTQYFSTYSSVDRPRELFYLLKFSKMEGPRNAGIPDNLPAAAVGSDTRVAAGRSSQDGFSELMDGIVTRLTKNLAPASGTRNILDFLHRFQDANKIEYLDSAIALTKSLPRNTGRYWLYIYASATEAYDKTNDPIYLDRAIEAGKSNVASPLGRAIFLDQLCADLYKRFARLGARQDIDQAIEYGEEAILTSPPGNKNWVTPVENLFAMMSSRYETSRAIEDLEKCIERGIAFMLDISKGSVEHAFLICTVAKYLSMKYRETADLSSLQQAIGYLETADLINSGEYRVGLLQILATCLDQRSKRLDSIADLDRSIEISSEALAMTPPDSQGRSSLVYNLSASVIGRFPRTKQPADISRALELAEEALSLTPVGHPDRGSRLALLASALYYRYEWYHVLEDLNYCIERAEEGIKLFPATHPYQPVILANFTKYLFHRYQRLGDLDDVEQAIQHSRRALMMIPKGHTDRPRILISASRALHTRFQTLLVHTEHTPKETQRLVEAAKDIEESIELARESLAVSVGIAGRAIALNLLALHLTTRYRAFNDNQDLEEAITLRHEILDSLPPYHPLRSWCLDHFANDLVLRWARTHCVEDFALYIKLSLEASDSDISGLYQKIRGAYIAAMGLATNGDFQKSMSLLENVVEMLPKLSPRSLARDDQEFSLSASGMISPLVASVLLRAGADHSHTLALLEHCRGIIMGLVIDYRSEVSELYLKSPELFERFNRLRVEIDSPNLEAGGGGAIEDWSCYQNNRRQREKAADDLEQTLVDIRKLPDLDRFLLPPAADELIAMAKEGPIVIVNSNPIGSDAFILTSSGIKVVNLGGLEYYDARSRMQGMKGLASRKQSTYARRSETMEKFLIWLWEVVVAPVLDELQLSIVEKELPRVWWIGIGILANAPFHAAGDHSPGSTQNTISRVISSYIPTIRALSFARQKKFKLPRSSDYNLLLVTMPTTPTQAPLKHAMKEVEDIVTTVNGKANTAILQSPGADMVLEQARSSHAIHFACHGVSDAKNPSNSRLLLRKNNDSGKEVLDNLTVKAIAGRHIKDAQIAYLSACSTADNASAKLVDESIHIASAFQLAGFSHVLATLWASNDGACRQVSKDFYERLFSEEVDGDREGHFRVSRAFHYAVKNLRDNKKNWAQPLLWASFMHTGA